MGDTNQVRGFVLTGRRSQTTADSQALVQLHWTRIDEIVDSEPVGPWMYAVTMSGLRRIKLD